MKEELELFLAKSEWEGGWFELITNGWDDLLPKDKELEILALEIKIAAHRFEKRLYELTKEHGVDFE
jgi:hypothetical protein